MIQERNIATCIILSIVTCGIYGLYWFVLMTNESNELAPECATASGGMALVLTIVTCNIYNLYWAYKMGDKLDAAKSARGIQSNSSGVLYLLLTLFGLSIVAWALIQNDLNSMA